MARQNTWGYSALNQINKQNVGRLQLAWSWALNTGASQPAPLVHDGVMFIPNPGGGVQALDATNGDLLWEYRRRYERADRAVEPMRSIAIYGDKIFVNTADAHIVALNVKTGAVAWDHQVADNALGYEYTSGPIIAKGKVVAGMTGCTRYKEDVCFISGHDPETGRELWRTATVAKPGEPGGDSLGRSALAIPRGRRCVDSGKLRSRHEPDLLVDGAGEALGARGARHRRRCALHQQHARARSRYGKDELVLPVPAGRNPRHGRGVREHPDRFRRKIFALQDGQARHPVGARPQDRQVHQRPRHRLSDARSMSIGRPAR